MYSVIHEHTAYKEIFFFFFSNLDYLYFTLHVMLLVIKKLGISAQRSPQSQRSLYCSFYPCL